VRTATPWNFATLPAGSVAIFFVHSVANQGRGVEKLAFFIRDCPCFVRKVTQFWVRTG
jgi:hypothetical protein